MANYIVTLGGKPTRVQATAFRGLLWDDATHLPHLDMEKLARLTPDERAHVSRIVAKAPQKSISDLYTLARRESCARKTHHDEEARTLLRSELKKKFYDPNYMGRDKVLMKCAVPAPGMDVPLFYKLAMRHYEFTPHEVRELAKDPQHLISLNRLELFFVLRRAGFIDAVSWKNPPETDVVDAPIDPLSVVQHWYKIPRRATLEHLAKFFGGEKDFFSFVERYAKWKQTSLPTAFVQLAHMELPETEAYSAKAWRRIFEKQMLQPLGGDLLQEIYPRMDKAQAFLVKTGRVLENCEAPTLRSAARAAHYRHADRNPVLAELCQELHFPEVAFERGLHAMENRAAQDLIPDINITGEEFDCPGYRVEKIAKDNPLILVAGAYANCCGHIDGAPKKMRMIKAMVTHPDVGCYVVRKEGDNRKIVAKLTIWLTPEDEKGNYGLVINSWHDSDARVKNAREPIISAIARHVQERDPKIDIVYAGKQGFSMAFPIVDPAQVTVVPRDTAIQTKDTRETYLVRRREPALAMAAP